MPNPIELQEAAEAIRNIRRLPAVQQHKQLDDPLQQSEEWAQREYWKVSEKNNDQRTGSAKGRSSTQS